MTENGVDRKLVIAGLTLALSSCAFAFEMIMTSDGPATIIGSRHLTIFGQPSSWPTALTNRETEQFDMTTTGSIDAARRIQSTLPSGVLDEKQGREPAGLIGFSVHGVKNGSALLMTPSGLIRANIGTDLGVAGVVKKIGATRDGWVIETSKGLILPLR
jgi:hypothetical protein